MDSFRFSPELFETRTEVIAMLADNGIEWLSDYSSVDPLHDVYGIEVCGVMREEVASRIRKLLRRMFPGWRHGHSFFKDYGREPGYKISIHRDDERQDEKWEIA